MYFTQEDYKKIENWLHRNSVKDTEFQEALPFTGEEIVTVVQDGHNRKVNIQEFINQLYKHGVEDFLNVTNTYRANNITLKEAISLIPAEARKEGQVITFLNTEGNWEIYQFTGKLNQWNNTTLWNNPFDWEKFVVDSILPDEEDLTKSASDAKGNAYLSLKDRKYEPDKYSGLGRKILRRRVVEIEDSVYGTQEKNILLQADFAEDNTVYVVRYDFTLNGQDITLPDNSYIEYEGGSISDGNIIDRAGGLNRIVLKKNIVNGKNILTQEMINKPNTIYEIRYNFDLIEAEITIPYNCVLNFQGGSFNNGKVIFNNTLLQGYININTSVDGNIINSYVTPEMFGALGDGENDDSEAIINAVSICSKIILNKKYAITRAITLPSYIEVIGNGTLIALDKIQWILECKSFTKIKNIKIDGKNLGSGGICIDYNCSNIQIENVTISNLKTYSDQNYGALGIEVGNRCSIVDINNCKISNIYPYENGKVGDGPGSGTGILVRQLPVKCRINNCTFENIHGDEDGDSIHVFSMADDTTYLSADVVIEQCNFYNMYKRAIKLQCNTAVVKNCTFINHLSENFNGVNECISIYGSNNIIQSNIFNINKCRYCINIQGERNIIDSNNITVDLEGKYTTVQGGNTSILAIQGKKHVIKNNEFAGIKNNIITLMASNIQICNNRFLSDTANYAIFIQGNADTIIITDNIIKLRDYVYFVSQYNSNVTNYIIANNTLLGLNVLFHANGGSATGFITRNNIVNIWKQLSTDNSANISKLYLEHSQFYKETFGNSAPSATGRNSGDTHINTNPTRGGYIGWVLTSDGWSPYGKIGE